MFCVIFCFLFFFLSFFMMRQKLGKNCNETWKTSFSPANKVCSTSSLVKIYNTPIQSPTVVNTYSFLQKFNCELSLIDCGLQILNGSWKRDCALLWDVVVFMRIQVRGPVHHRKENVHGRLIRLDFDLYKKCLELVFCWSFLCLNDLLWS